MAGFFNKLKNALTNTSSKIGSGIEHLFINKKLDDATLEELEELLLFADTGISVTDEIIGIFRKKKFNKEVTSGEIKQDLNGIISQILNKQDHRFELLPNKLNIILLCGVNGNGKTTTVGKLAHLYINQGKKIAVAACDTFRAAAVEQIEQWTDRTGARLFKGDPKADPASVAHKAIIESSANGTDILFIDTAGRLHNQENLMQELAKIIRIIKKIDETAPHHCLLVLDGTTGRNAEMQVERFKQAANISGLIVTKLDGTAKAGAIVGIIQRFNIPVHFIGLGEGIDDLKPFSPEDFAKALVGA